MLFLLTLKLERLGEEPNVHAFFYMYMFEQALLFFLQVPDVMIQFDQNLSPG